MTSAIAHKREPACCKFRFVSLDLDGFVQEQTMTSRAKSCESFPNCRLLAVPRRFLRIPVSARLESVSVCKFARSKR